MYKYPIIVFEGIEASGKSTNLDCASKYLKKIKRNFIKIREPGGSKLASRSENVDKIIKKNYKKKIILIDRFTDSTLAYQHYGMKININLIKNINNFIIGNLKPDLIFLSVVNKKKMKKRLILRKKTNKYDKFNFTFYDRVQKGFLKIANNKKKYIILNSNTKNIEETRSFLINKINKII